MLLSTNLTISTQRWTQAAGSKQSVLSTHLSNVPVYVRPMGVDRAAKGLSAEYDALITFDASWDVADGDKVLGYDPLGSGPGGADGRSNAPTVTVGHVEVHQGIVSSFKTALLRVDRP